MPRKPSRASKTSLYKLQLRSSDDLKLGIQQKYLDQHEFRTESVMIGQREGLLVYGVIANESPSWVKHAMSLTSTSISLRNQNSAGVVLVRLDDESDHCYALTWSMGHLVVNPIYVDDGFGLRFALRRADPEDVRALTIHALDTVSRTSRTSVIGGAPLDSFGMEEVGEIVSRLVGRVVATGFASDKLRSGQEKEKDKVSATPKKVTIRGADALGIPLAKSPADLLSDLTLIDSIVSEESPVQELKHLEHTQPLRPSNPKIPTLANELAKNLESHGRMVALSWPSEFDEEPGEIAKYQFNGLGRAWNGTYEELELECLTAPLTNVAAVDRIKKLRGATIQGLADDGRALTRAISADKWLTFQTELGEQRYVFHRGRWFNVGGAYLVMLKERVKRIFECVSDVSLPPWPQQQRVRKSTGEPYIGRAVEAAYNDQVVGQLEGYYSLDRKLIRTEQHPRGFEACDLLTPDNKLVHVKRLDDSVAASHLFNQAMNSAEALRRQPDALRLFRERVREVSAEEKELPKDFEPNTVVIAFGGRERSADDLFTFSQVSLSRCAKRIAELGMRLEIAHILDVDDIIA